MIKKFRTVPLILCFLLLCSCGEPGSIVMPFEATFHKFVYTLTKDLEEISKNPNENHTVLCKNGNYELILEHKNDTISFHDLKNNTYYDTFGNASDTLPTTGLNIEITQRNTDFKLNYEPSAYYNNETESDVNTLTAFKLSENTVRLLIVTGVNEFEIIDSVPLVLTEDIIASNPNLSEYYSDSETAKEHVTEAHTLLEKRLDLRDGLFYLNGELSREKAFEMGITKNTSREVALSLNYHFSDVTMILTTVDITVTDDGFIFDISKNRQFRSELIRDESFKHNIFDFEIDFVEITRSESEKITDAQSKY